MLSFAEYHCTQVLDQKLYEVAVFCADNNVPVEDVIGVINEFGHEDFSNLMRQGSAKIGSLGKSAAQKGWQGIKGLFAPRERPAPAFKPPVGRLMPQKAAPRPEEPQTQYGRADYSKYQKNQGYYDKIFNDLKGAVREQLNRLELKYGATNPKVNAFFNQLSNAFSNFIDNQLMPKVKVNVGGSPLRMGLRPAKISPS